MKKREEDFIFRQYKPLLFSIAYRMLGSVEEAEDIVQETLLAYYQRDIGAIQNEKAYLCKMVTNLCIDTLKSSQKKREVYTGPWLPEPYIISEEWNDPLVQVITQDSLSISYLLMMENLSPTERAVFILRDVYRFSYREISEIVNKSEVNCRKIFERSREKLPTDTLETTLNNDDNQSIIIDFVKAFQKGDMKKVMELLSEEVTLFSDGGGMVKAAINPIQSRNRVVPFLIGVVTKAPIGLVTEIKNVNGQLGLVNTIDTAAHSVISFHIADGKIGKIYIVLNPEKLTHINLK